MQARFKFRVWLKYCRLMYDISSFCYLNGLDKCVFHFENGNQKTLKSKDFEIMQSTGLKDKNGKLIYEGDIVKIVDNNALGYKRERIGEVKYGYGNIYPAFYVLTTLGDAKDFTEDMEIIGNIYENPELLENNQ